MAHERLTKCPLCKSGLFLNHAEVKDYAVSGEKFLLCQCTSCKLIFTNPRPKQEEISQYYQSENYISHRNKANNLTNLLYKTVRQYTLRQKVNWLNQYSSHKGNLLDIGCGTGYFLQKAKQNGWKTEGIEPNSLARKTAKKKGLKIFSDLSKIKEENKYQAITMFHVLEHIHDLRKTAKRVVSILEDEGTLLIAVPNYDSLDSKIYGEKWAGLDVPRHLYHFTKETMQVFAEKMGLYIAHTEPMKFDSYYVSLLSENYLKQDENKLQQLYKGFMTGLKSNQWAKKNKANYSSILFILKKK